MLKIPGKIDKIHVIYLGIIVLLTFGYGLGFIFYDNDYTVNIISVSSGVFSIAIGMLAMGIALYQGFTQETSIQKINESANRVEEATKKLGAVDFTELTKKVSDIHERTSFDLFEKNTSDNDEQVTLNKQVIKSLFLSVRVHKYLGYCIKRCYEEGRVFNYFAFGKAIDAIHEISDVAVEKDFHSGAAISYIASFKKVDGVVVNNTKEGIKFLELNDNFKELVDDTKVEINESTINMLEDIVVKEK